MGGGLRPSPLFKKKITFNVKIMSKNWKRTIKQWWKMFFCLFCFYFPKVVHLQVLEHLVSNNLIHHEHHGGMLGNTTTTAVATMLDIWSEALEN